MNEEPKATKADFGLNPEFWDKPIEIAIKPKVNENFYRDSLNVLIHTMQYLDAVPEILQNIAPINYEQIPDYLEEFSQKNLEQQQADSEED